MAGAASACCCGGGLAHTPAHPRRILFGYEGNNKIVPKAKGQGPIDGRTDQIDGSGVDEWLSNLNEDEVQFSLLKMTMGDRESKRPKFVMVTWIGPSVGVMKKAKAGMHGATVKEFIGQIHNEMQEDDKELLTFDIIRKKVKSAMGADYDMGSNSRKAGGKGEANSYQSQQSDIKAKAKAAYQQAEKETTIGSVVFDQGPLTKGITACDLGGRATTASNTEAKKNMSAVMVDATGETGRTEGAHGAPSTRPGARATATWPFTRPLKPARLLRSLVAWPASCTYTRTGGGTGHTHGQDLDNQIRPDFGQIRVRLGQS